MGLAYRGNAIRDENGVAIDGRRVTGMAGAGSRVYHRRAEWVRGPSWSAIRNTLSQPVDTTGCDLLLIGVSSQTQAPTLNDSRGNTWRIAVEQGSPSTSRLWFACPAIVGPGHVFQALSGAQVAMTGMAWSGSLGVFSLVSSTASGPAGSTTNVTPQHDNSLLFSHCGAAGPGSFFPPGTWTQLSQISGVAGDYNGCAVAFMIQPVAAPASIAWTGTATKNGTTLAAFRPA